MRQECGLNNCNNPRTAERPGAEVGYIINNLTRRVLVCNECAFKLMGMPRGTWEITKHRELKPIPARPAIIT